MANLRSQEVSCSQKPANGQLRQGVSEGAGEESPEPDRDMGEREGMDREEEHHVLGVGIWPWGAQAKLGKEST